MDVADSGELDGASTGAESAVGASGGGEGGGGSVL